MIEALGPPIYASPRLKTYLIEMRSCWLESSLLDQCIVERGSPWYVAIPMERRVHAIVSSMQHPRSTVSEKAGVVCIHAPLKTAVERKVGLVLTLA